jgi:hypothetical protein
MTHQEKIGDKITSFYYNYADHGLQNKIKIIVKYVLNEMREEYEQS